jgi:tripartite-type tricarboxylate transporter receptor subunit TctC
VRNAREDGVKLGRRRFLHLAAGVAVALAFFRVAAADDYPTHTVRIVDGFGPGSTPDLVSRLFGQWFSDHLGQPFVVENRTGAGGNVAAETVLASPADGYTLLGCVTAHAINASVYQKLDYDFLRDFAPVGGILRFPMVLLVNPTFPATTFPEFLAYAKANPGKVNVASPGVGTPMHVAIEMLNMMAGIDLVHVPYRGASPGMTDVISGQVQAFIITLSTASGFIKAGKVRPLAVAGATRSNVFPDIPSIGETLPGFDAATWDGLCAPKGTPAAAVGKLNGNIRDALSDPAIKERIGNLGGETEPMSVAEFGKFMTDETAKWARVVKFANIKTE